MKKVVNKKIYIAVISVLLVVIVALGIFVSDIPKVEAGTCEFHFIDVGQGDAQLMRTENHNILIDTGTTSSRYSLAQYLKRNVDVIDLMIITHPHEDHMGGAYEILQSIEVSEVTVIDEVTDESFFVKVLDEIEKQGIRFEKAESGAEYVFDSLKLTFMLPEPSNNDDMNELSLLVRADFGENSVLFTGDSTSESESSLLEQYQNDLFNCDILKVAHHGSAYSSGKDFLRAVSADIAVIEVGKNNSFGHPAEEVLERLAESGICKIRRTDKDGTVIFVSDGKTFVEAESNDNFFRIFDLRKLFG